MLFQSPRTSKPQPVYRQHEYTDDRMAELDRLIAAGLGDVRPAQHRKQKPRPGVHGLGRYSPNKRARLDAIAERMRKKYAARRPNRTHKEGCSISGCDRKFHAKGMCHLHYDRKRRA